MTNVTNAMRQQVFHFITCNEKNNNIFIVRNKMGHLLMRGIRNIGHKL